jgi:hypothetical protein
MKESILIKLVINPTIEAILRKDKTLTKMKKYIKLYSFNKREDKYIDLINLCITDANNATIIREFIGGAFAWELTPEGKDYWSVYLTNPKLVR